MYKYVVELSTPEDDVATMKVSDRLTADRIFESINLSDNGIPRVSIFAIEGSTWKEIRRKETEAWAKSVAIAKEEEGE